MAANNSTRRTKSRGAASAITHADLAPTPRGVDLSGKGAALLTVVCILCGLFCFLLSLFAEATRSQVTWVATSEGGNKGPKAEYECVYSGSGKLPLLCASVAFVALAIAMLVHHAFLLFAISKTTPPTYASWDPEGLSQILKPLSWQAGFFFISTWVCFAIGEIMLLIGLSVESGHLKDWSTPRPSCLIVRTGVFTAAGVFALLTVFLATSLYATALKVQWVCQEQEVVRREVEVASVFYASPPRSPHHRATTTTTTTTTTMAITRNSTNDIRQSQDSQKG